MTSTLPLHAWTATRLRDALADGELTAVEVMTAFLDRIDELNPTLNVVVFQLPRDECLALAAAADELRATGAPLGPLHGLPIAIKDLAHVAGMPTTQGSRRFADDPPHTEDSPHVALIRAAGALIIGKTNAPEFGVGTVTWNDVFGATRNPWDPSRHSGGSTAGAAAVAAGLLPLSDGGDSGGSLRIPGSFCNVVGLRTTPGTVPLANDAFAWDPHAVLGPMARTCEDAALLLSAMSGPAPGAPPTARRAPTTELPAPADRPLRLAWSADLGGLPVDPEVAAAVSAARAAVEAAGHTVVDVEIDTDGLDDAWQVIEMFGWFATLGLEPVESPELFRDDFVANVTEGSQYTPEQIRSAMSRRYRAWTEMASLLAGGDDAAGGFDAFVCPGAPVVAPPAEVPWVAAVAGTTFDRYLLWQRLACRLTVTAHPVLALPATFTPEGLPVGLQLVGTYGEDVALLDVGRQLEGVFGVADRMPPSR